VKLDASFDPSIPNFRFDYQKVQQAAANLLDNALKHTPAGGTVTLHAGPISGNGEWPKSHRSRSEGGFACQGPIALKFRRG